ncbi:glycosyltransferase [Thomasclavelia sp.]|uniref:glycosyltransferase n=1 Tax=Thomasclavelia sp. TaxID=3025757 RepID=UPI00345D9CD4
MTFVDSDDYLDKNAIKLLLDALLKNNADVNFGTFTRVLGKHGFIKKRYATIFMIIK